MTIYSINLGIGWASSGVEYAQAYRATVLRGLHLPAKFIFMDMFQAENLQHLTANIGFRDEEIIWLYGHFTDIKVAATTYPLTKLEESFPYPIQLTEGQDGIKRYTFEGSELTVVASLCGPNHEYVQRVEYLSEGRLIRKDYFSYVKTFTEYYVQEDGKPVLHHRVFLNADGSVAYREENWKERTIYRFPDKVLYSKDELIACFLESLCLSSQDILLLDRATGIGQAVFQHKGEAKLAVVVHAEHYNAKATDEDNILWNNYYEYQFTNADKVDAFITSTHKQKETLLKQFAKYSGCQPAVFVIPVGSLDKLRKPQSDRKPFSLITGSRLAAEKHIDWLVQAVLLAKSHLPELQLDIYGEGGQRQKLQEMIQEGQAEDYIRLKGHQKLTEIYQDYQVYVTASTSEGFGLTLLEAIGSGLPIIGLDVPYGNQTFITSGRNGYLIDRSEVDDSKVMARAFADAILAYFQQSSQKQWENRMYSYGVAKRFLYIELERAWLEFVEEIAK